MIRGIAILACLAASSCGSGNTKAASAHKKVDTLGAPAAAQVAPTGADCLGNAYNTNSGFSNTKECLMVACEAGDEPSCRLMETYNGNLDPSPSRNKARDEERLSQQLPS